MCKIEGLGRALGWVAFVIIIKTLWSGHPSSLLLKLDCEISLHNFFYNTRSDIDSLAFNIMKHTLENLLKIYGFFLYLSFAWGLWMLLCGNIWETRNIYVCEEGFFATMYTHTPSSSML